MEPEDAAPTSLFQRMADMATMAKEKRGAEIIELNAYARAGNQEKICDYAKQHSQCGHTSRDFLRVLFDMCKEPKEFKDKTGLMNSLPRMFFDSPEFFKFITHSQIGANMLWIMVVKDGSKDALHAAARLQAEITRLEIRNGKQVSIIPDAFLNSFGTLSNIFLLAEKKECFVKIQNILVDFVAASNGNDMTTTGGFLQACSDLEGSELWTRKISAIAQTPVLKRLIGRPNNFTPVFE